MKCRLHGENVSRVTCDPRGSQDIQPIADLCGSWSWVSVSRVQTFIDFPHSTDKLIPYMHTKSQNHTNVYKDVEIRWDKQSMFFAVVIQGERISGLWLQRWSSSTVSFCMRMMIQIDWPARYWRSSICWRYTHVRFVSLAVSGIPWRP